MHTSPRVRSVLEAAGILLLRAVFRPLTPRGASRAGSALGWLLHSVVRLKRRQTLETIALALGDVLDEAERRRIVARCYRQFGAVIGEFVSEPRLVRRNLDDFVEIENLELIDRLLARGHGLLISGGHLGNWELVGSALARRGYAFTGYVGRQHNPLADAYINWVRRSLGTETIPKEGGMRGMLRALKQGRVLMMLSDQHFSRNRYFVRFFGRPVSATTGVAALVLHAGVPAVFPDIVRVGRFRYRARFVEIPVPPSSGDAELDQLRITQGFFDLLEAAVRRNPELYFWMHRRFREPPRPEELSESNRAFLAERDAPAAGPRRDAVS